MWLHRYIPYTTPYRDDFAALKKQLHQFLFQIQYRVTTDDGNIILIMCEFRRKWSVSKLAAAAMPLTCIRKLPGSNLDQDTDYFN
jgi:hypothetical protein